MNSIAAQIPPELYTNILSFVGPYDVLSIPGPSDEKKEAKRHLSACSLTCFYWATQCRERLFRFITLKSGEDIHAFRLFTRHPPLRLPSILTQTRFLTAEWDLKAQKRPWVHNLYIFLQYQGITLADSRDDIEGRSDRRVSLALHLFGPSPDITIGRQDIVRHTLNKWLPRDMPAHFRRCHSLLMGDFQFNEFLDFVGFLRSMRFTPDQLMHHQTYFSFRNINFTRPYSPYTSFFLFVSRPARVLINAENCNDYPALICGSLAQLEAQFGRPAWASDFYLAPEGNGIILAIADSLLRTSSTLKTRTCLRLVRAGHDGSDIDPAAQLYMDIVNATAAHEDIGHDRLSPKFCFEAKATYPGSNEYYIARVTINMAALNMVTAEEFEAGCLAYDWVAIGEVLQRLQGPSSIDLDFHLKRHILQCAQSQRLRDTLLRLEKNLSVYLFDEEKTRWNVITDLNPLLYPSDA